MNMSKEDVRAHGVYVSPLAIQILNQDGSVKETRTLTDNGKETITKGGVHGVPTGTPGNCVKAQAKHRYGGCRDEIKGAGSYR